MTSPRYLAVYGAYVALQMHERMREGRGAPSDEDMAYMVEEGHSVAEWSERTQPAPAQPARADLLTKTVVRAHCATFPLPVPLQDHPTWWRIGWGERVYRPAGSSGESWRVHRFTWSYNTSGLVGRVSLRTPMPPLPSTKTGRSTSITLAEFWHEWEPVES